MEPRDGGRQLADLVVVSDEAGGSPRLADDAELSNVLRSRNYTKSGGLVNCEWYSSALRDENGEQLSVLSLLQAIGVNGLQFDSGIES